MTENDLPNSSPDTRLHPAVTDFFVGHEKIMTQLAAMVAEDRLPHALMFAGMKGVGKATLGYRLARYLLAKEAFENNGAALAPPIPIAKPKESAAPDLFGGGLFGDDLLGDTSQEGAEKEAQDSLLMAGSSATPEMGPKAMRPDDKAAARFDVAIDHPVFRQLAQGSHADFMLVSRGVDAKTGKKRQEIRVEEVRAISQFLRKTTSQGAWKIVMIDAADDMNPNAANALLKILEEPPAKSLLILVTHNFGKLLPTIRSRCHRFDFRGLSEEEIKAAYRHYFEENMPSECRELPAFQAGSFGLLCTSYNQKNINLINDLKDISDLGPEQKIAAISRWVSQNLQGSDQGTTFEEMGQIILEWGGAVLHENMAKSDVLTLSEAEKRQNWQKLKDFSEISAFYRKARGLKLDPSESLFRLTGEVLRLAA